MERWYNRVAVVTGASSGIGEACARKLVKAGLRIVALARREQRLIENRSNLPTEQQSRYFIRKCDVTNEDEVNETFAWIEKTLGGTDILINNAGILRLGGVLEVDTKVMDEVMKTNLYGAIYCARAAFKSMKARNVDGHFVHMNSVAGLNITPINEEGFPFNVYHSSKFALTALNEILRQELYYYKTNIKTTSIHPALVDNELTPRETLAKYGNSLSTDDVADSVLYVIGTPPNVLIKELTIKSMGTWY